MKIRFPNYSKTTIKSFIFFWTGIIIVSVVLLSIALLFASKKYHNFTNQVLVHSQNVELTHQLESTILAERREDLLWRSTQNEQHRLNSTAELNHAHDLLRELDVRATKMADELKIDKMEVAFEKFGFYSKLDAGIPLNQVKVLADSLLQTIEIYREKNRIEMENIVMASQNLNQQLERWSMALVVFVALLVAIGAFTLINRIVLPTIELSKTAQDFGKGDFNARAQIIRQDELGQLSETFNEMAAELKKKEMNQQEFVASIIHDLKNPLVVIGGAANMLLNGSIEAQQRNYWLGRIVKQIEGMERLLYDLMDNIQAETGQLSLQLKELDLSVLIRNIREEQNQVIPSHEIIFEGEDDCRILGDVKRLERVTLNLISNAVKFSPENSVVTLRLAKNESHVVFIVRDQGIGIAEEDLKKLFKPFGRLHQKETKGVGMGLVTVKKIIEGHSGSIRVVSQVGIGTSFEILLPKI